MKPEPPPPSPGEQRARLPIDEALPALRHSLLEGPRVLLHAPPGAGKSTVVPLALLDAPWRRGRRILMLEPRRIAARAVAERMAAMLGESTGRTVGYRTRLDTRVDRDTRIEVLTEGILTRMLQEDSALEGVACVIFDEFHERSLNADLGLALCLEAQETLREDLRVLVMSATIDLEPLRNLLGGAPVVGATGRSFEVITHHLPRRAELPLERQLSQCVRTALAEHPGDILCFLPGAAEINRLQSALAAGPLPADTQVLPLYGELGAAAQDTALAPPLPGVRKVVLATSIAETSLTIEGVRIVIDSGLRRYAEFDPATGMSRLVTGKVSQAAAEQRRGRAGRLSSGVCYRLWSEGVQATLAAHTPPEIVHADLAPLALELARWGTADAATLRWLDPPPPAPLDQARALLRQLQALDACGRITPHGQALARAGAHPRLAHMLVRAGEMGAARLACDLAAILSERDVLRAAAGFRDGDLRLRVAALRGERSALPSGMTVERRAMTQAQRNSALWQRRFAPGADTDADPHTACGLLLALAYPDRIAQARGDGLRYLLANGRGARFSEPQSLAKSEYLVAAELDGAEREARIFLGAPLRGEDLLRHCRELITEHAFVAWDPREQAVRARRERRLGALVLESVEVRDADPEAVLRATLDGLRQLGIEALPWTRELRQWQARVALLRRLEVHAPQPWPALDDVTLLDTLAQWAPPWLEGRTRREHLARVALRDALESRLSHAQSALLEREAPTHFVVPSGSRLPIDYLDGEVPTLSVRLQEVFGLTATPSVAGGRLPLLLKLLSPAGRPVQITRDLVSFWARGYHEVRKDLKGRYPKHYWPDDPHGATPTRRVKPR